MQLEIQAVAVEEIDRAGLQIERIEGAIQGVIEDPIEIERATRHRPDPVEGGKLLGAAGRLAEEAGVLQGDRRLIGEEAEEFDIGGSEGAAIELLDPQHPHDPLARAQRGHDAGGALTLRGGPGLVGDEEMSAAIDVSHRRVADRHRGGIVGGAIAA